MSNGTLDVQNLNQTYLLESLSYTDVGTIFEDFNFTLLESFKNRPYNSELDMIYSLMRNKEASGYINLDQMIT